MTHFPSSFLRAARTSACLLALGLAGAGVLAQPMAGQEHGHRMSERGERSPARHLESLKGKLKLTAAQEPAWTSFTQAMQARPAGMGPGQAREELAKLSTPERIERMKSLHAQRQAEMNGFMNRRLEATQAFYAALTPEQKKTFDAETARIVGEHGGEGRHGRMHSGRG